MAYLLFCPVVLRSTAYLKVTMDDVDVMEIERALGDVQKHMQHPVPVGHILTARETHIQTNGPEAQAKPHQQGKPHCQWSMHTWIDRDLFSYGLDNSSALAKLKHVVATNDEFMTHHSMFSCSHVCKVNAPAMSSK